MERDMSSQALCRCGCGFYGNPATDGMCSKCFKDAMKRKQAPPAGSSSASSSSSNNVNNNNNNNNSISTQISNAISNSLNEATASTVVASLAAALNVRPEAGLPSLDKETTSIKSETSSVASVISVDKVGALDPPTSGSAGSDLSVETPTKTQKKKKTRCTKCKINVGCIGFPCRCGGIFCATHRYANEHGCSFDYKEHGAEEIRKNNPQIVGEKIQKI